LAVFRCLSRYFTGVLIGSIVLFSAACDREMVDPLTPVGASNSFAATQSRPTPRAFPDFISLVKSQGAAVVSISSEKKVSGRAEASGVPAIPGLPPDHPLYEFFRYFGFGDVPLHDLYRQSLGSGFIVDSAGYVLTNAHVVADADEVTVGLTDKREFKAVIVGSDRRTDIALLKVSAENLPAVKIGDPSRLEVGEWVVAIGIPFGFANSVTQGIVSAKGRTLPGGAIVPFIQTDAAINPGNSGGPLFNLMGEVVGVNSQIYSQSGGYMGLSFAIPIDVAMKVKDQLLQHGSVQRGRLGVRAQDVSPELAESFGMAMSAGVLIAEVEKGGPADKCGIKAGDIVLQFEGNELTSAADLVRAILGKQPGDNVRLDVWRNGSTMEMTATLGSGDDSPASAKSKPVPPSAVEFGRAGLKLRELSSAEQRAGHVEGSIVVEAVDGVAEQAGIEPGDLILAVNNKTVSSIEQLRREMGPNKKRVALLIARGQDSRMFIPLTLAEP